jgi:hypothetical protein
LATEYKTGDTFPDLAGTIQDASGNAINVSTATSIRMVAKRTGGTEVITGTTIKDDDGTVPLRGRWHYVFASGDLAVAGTYEVEVEVTWTAGKIETFPDAQSRNPTFVVTPDLD